MNLLANGDCSAWDESFELDNIIRCDQEQFAVIDRMQNTHSNSAVLDLHGSHTIDLSAAIVMHLPANGEQILVP
jgi:hypothetical protein